MAEVPPATPVPAAPLGSRRLPAARGLGWVLDGFRLLRADLWAWLLMALVLAALMVLLNYLPVLGPLLAWLLTPVFTGGLMRGLQKAGLGLRVSVGDLFAGFDRHLGALLLVGLAGFGLTALALVPASVLLFEVSGSDMLVSLAVSEPMMLAAQGLTVAFALGLALLLFLVLLVPVVMLTWFAPALVILEDEPPLAALKHSFIGCLRNPAAFLVYGLVGLLLFPLLLAATFGLGILVLLPAGAASIYVAYRDIFHRS